MFFYFSQIIRQNNFTILILFLHKKISYLQSFS